MGDMENDNSWAWYQQKFPDGAGRASKKELREFKDWLMAKNLNMVDQRTEVVADIDKALSPNWPKIIALLSALGILLAMIRWGLG